MPATALGLIVILGIGVSGCGTESGARAGSKAPGTSSITYYSDAHGVFTLVPPHGTTGYTITLRGSCSLPEIMLQVDKKRAGLPVRNATYRTGGRPAFAITYLIKDGAGDYEIFIFGKKSLASRDLAGLCSFTVRSTAVMPAGFRGLYINDRILSFVDRVIGTTVGGGECWDLAQEALDSSGADWVRPFTFGKPLDPESDRIIPGDIIQFRSVRLRTTLPGGGFVIQNIGEPDHTAVIIGIEGENRYEIAHQNSGGKRYVITSSVDLNSMKSGSYRIYRPVAGIIK